MTRREYRLIIITAFIMCVPIAILAYKNKALALQSAAYEWKDMKAVPNQKGERRDVFDSPTETLDKLELHITTLNPGDSSHAPHQHVNEELLIIKEGNVSALVSGEWKQLGPGSVIYQAAYNLHSIRNTGSTPTTYYALQWRTEKTGK